MRPVEVPELIRGVEVHEQRAVPEGEIAGHASLRSLAVVAITRQPCAYRTQYTSRAILGATEALG